MRIVIYILLLSIFSANLFSQDLDNQFEEIIPYTKELSWTYMDGYIGMIDRTGKVVIPNQYTKIENFVNRVAVCHVKRKKGIITINGKILVEPEFDNIEPFGKLHYKIKKKGKFVLLKQKRKDYSVLFQSQDRSSFPMNILL